MSKTDCTTLIRARFGIAMGQDAERSRERVIHMRARASTLALIDVLKPGRVALIVGPSGSGKSMIVRALCKALTSHQQAKPISPRTTKPTIEILRSPLKERLRTLSVCGLADAHPLVTPAGQLSEGQKARLSLARAFDKAERSRSCTAVIADEFCSSLDRTTAASVAGAVRRLVKPPLRFVAATAHDDLIEHLRPDVLVYVPLEGTPEILTTKPVTKIQTRKKICQRIPGRSCPIPSESGSCGRATTIPGRSASAGERSTTTHDCPVCTTERLTRQRSSA